MTQRTWQWTAATTVIAIGLACTPSYGGRDTSADAAAPASDTQAQRIDHLTPRRDSIGRVPSHFEWTRVEGADRYAIGVWSEADSMVWRQDNIPDTRVAWPKELPLEPGTYFWSVTALQQDRVVGDSGRAAFIVRTDEP